MESKKQSYPSVSHITNGIFFPYIDKKMVIGTFVRKMRNFLKRKFFKEPQIKPIFEQVVPGVVFIGIEGIPEPGRMSRILEFLGKHREQLIIGFLVVVLANLFLRLF